MTDVSTKVGIEETKDVLMAINTMSIDLIKLIRKHMNALEVVSTLVGDAELRDILQKAYEGITKVPGELKDLDVTEGIELAMAQGLEVPKIIAAFKTV